MAYDEYKHAGSDEYKFIQMTDIDEQQPDAVLKGAEYVEYLGLYFNREKEASAAIQHIVDNYMCTKKAVEGVVLENEPVPVLWAQYWSGATCSDGSSGGWSVASANTWYAELIRAAGGSLIIPDVEAACESYGAPYLSTEQLLEVGADAAVMISPGPFPEDQDVSSLKAWENGRVFDNQGPNGANDWFERRVVEPDAMLQDLALAFYPDDGPTATFSRKWLRDVRAGEPIGGVADEDLDAACPDIDAPYEFSSTEMCAQISTDDGPGPIDDGNPGCYDVSIHECDCSVMSEEDCPAPMVWTSGCASCAGGDDGGDESDSATRAVLAAAAVVAALVF